MDAANQYRVFKAGVSQAESIVRFFKDLGPVICAVFSGLFYIFGFLVFNANLVKNGIVEYEFINAKYIFSGAAFFLFLICFYLFAGRSVAFMPRWLGENIKHYRSLGLGNKWNVVAFVHSLVCAIFSCCLSAGLFSAIAFCNNETTYFDTVLVGSFIILYTFDVTNRDLKCPRTYLVVSLVIHVIAMVVFFVSSNARVLGTVFGLMVALFFFLNLVLDIITRYGFTADRLFFSGVYTFVVFLISAIVFGTTIYGQISSKIGGPQSQSVDVVLTKDSIVSFPPDLVSGIPPLVSGKLIYQNERYVYLSVADQRIRVSNSDIVALVMKPEFR